MRCVSNTILALVSSTTVTFFVSHFLTTWKFDPVHIANATLAGDVAIGCSGRLSTRPGDTDVGMIAGATSVAGYVHLSPYLEERHYVFDTGIGNLHGLPALVEGIASMILPINADEEFLNHSTGQRIQTWRGGLLYTLWRLADAGQ